jgi:REP element-mobilizing transposase RayT
MSTGYQIHDQEGLYYLTFQVVDWIDIFTRQVYRNIIIESLNYAIQNKGLEVFAFVIMSNHVHLIAQSNKGILSDTIRDIKKYTSKKIIETIQTTSESRKDWMLNQFRYWFAMEDCVKCSRKLGFRKAKLQTSLSGSSHFVISYLVVANCDHISVRSQTVTLKADITSCDTKT